MYNDLFDMAYGPQGSDCTGPYFITLKRECTVREFIDYWLKNYSNEWGYFRIKTPTFSLGTAYNYGKITANLLNDNELDSVIKKVHGSGGWSRSDFVFEI